MSIHTSLGHTLRFALPCLLGALASAPLAPATSLAQDTAPGVPLATPVSIAPGVTEGALEVGDGCDEDGYRADEYVLDLRRGEIAYLWLASDQFDTLLRVTRPDGGVLESDDLVPGALHSGLQFRAEADGRYAIRVRGFSPEAAGSYRLGYERFVGGDGAPILDLTGERMGQSLTPGGIGGVAESGGRFWLQARGGERVTFRVTSQDFDTVAILFGPTGQVWSNDDGNDIGPDGTERPVDSTLTAHLGVEGWYSLLVAPYGAAGGGTFNVRTTHRGAITLAPGEARPSEGYAGTEGEGRILGLFAGISDYQGDGSDLYGCDDDATFLAQAFRERGIQGEADQTVLTDAAVTRDGVLTAIAQIAAEAGENDVVVVFYSGHGNQITDSTPDPADFDGSEETLSVYDGDITDDDLVQALSAIRANTVILALDSCHSGGFARDWVSAPGRIGIFSSDEDVLSDTAEPLRAGGYLSYYLRRAILGDADVRPADGAITAGELTDFLYSGFVTSFEGMNPPAGQDPLQRLVVARGALGWHDLLWIHPRDPSGALPVVDVVLDSEVPGEPTSAGGRCE